MITIYATSPGTASPCPQLVSADSGYGTPIPWARDVWTNDADGVAKIARCEVATGAWAFVNYSKAAPVGDSWVGLSEITASCRATRPNV